MACLYLFKCEHGKSINFTHQCELCAKERLAAQSETVRTQQAEIERLKGQRDRLLDAIKLITPQISAKAKRARASQQEILLLQLIAEIEAEK